MFFTVMGIPLKLFEVQKLVFCGKKKKKRTICYKHVGFLKNVARTSNMEIVKKQFEQAQKTI